MQKTIYSPEYAELLRWLRAERRKAGLTMRGLGKKLGVIHSWIGKVEQAERRLDLVEYLRICEALKINPHEGIDRIQTMKPTQRNTM